MTEHKFSLIPASYVYLLCGDAVLLQRRQHTGYMDGYWVAGATGHIEPGETARQAAVREAKEELGVAVDSSSLELASVMQRTDGTDNPREQRADWFWTARDWRGDPMILEPHKASDISWFRLSALPSQVPEYERQILEGLRNGSLRGDTQFGFHA